ncbi:MAG: fumarate hydratase [Acidimicrobiia bacterium BACL6 MAG-121220-bin61]|jgi:fumarate hydratase, class I|nr:MAG: fumarate hydratase [Acidimicrobiia bacterium BACL6 MAG-120910-bin40]KRO57110.1 MAG: fumarate hydratase [Acidimicrobiia bacterium BACL6 MAG-120322-bin79]KRO65849.1 MAG: fumarate hydratase [Acidimicrobiia bacterium BACL6 MAG-121220-bin61]HAG67796.1 fumarate hydratase [Acidimicrobium sp.]
MAKPPQEPFTHSELLPLGPDTTEYRLLTTQGVSTFSTSEGTFLKVSPEAITHLTEHAMRDIAHLLRTSHLQQLANILKDLEASDNDRFVALDLLKNASIAAGGILPMCQDTGTAIVKAKKGQRVYTGGGDDEAISRGIYNTYQTSNLRYSQLAPLSMFEEVNTDTNLPAEIKIAAVDGDEYKFLFIAKGGGSANKSYLFQETKALLNEKTLLPWLFDKMKTLGTAACPPYHLAIVVGGTSAEFAVETAKLASTHYLDSLPTSGSKAGHAFRDIELEAKVLKLAQLTGIGAQFGGKYFCHDVRVIRLPRHGASCPIAMAVSCSADRQALGKITADGVFLEVLETDPARFLPEVTTDQLASEVVAIDLNQSMSEIRDTLSKYPVKTRVMLSGPMVVARDIAHAKIKERLDAGEGLPQYMKDHCVYYAGPAKTPEGMASGSFGPTTAGRMDSYVAEFQAAGGSFVMLAKGNRSRQVTDACNTYGGFYLGSIGGPAARLAQDCITKVEVLEYAELGMEAVWKIEVHDFPAFIVVDDKGNDFFDAVNATSGVQINIR